MLRPGWTREGSLVSVQTEENGQPKDGTVQAVYQVTEHLQKPDLKVFFNKLGYNPAWKRVHLWRIQL